MGVEDNFNTHLADIESKPLAYAGFQKLMVRQAIAERPVLTFCELGDFRRQTLFLVLAG